MGNDEVTDAELMQAAASWDEAAFRDLFERHRARAWGKAMRLTAAEADAADLVQDTWVRLLSRADAYQEQGRFGAYLETVMTRLWLDQLKKRRPVPVADPEPEQEAAEEERPTPRPDLWQAVCALPEAQRLAITMRVHGGAGYDEIAAALGTTRKAAEMLLRRARRALAASLGARK
jgi:RNA polymerase sigma-70 factor (ECF subfamily)